MLTTTHIAVGGAVGRLARLRGDGPAGRVARLVGARHGLAPLLVGGLLPDLALLLAMVGTAAASAVAGEDVRAAVGHLLATGFTSAPLELAHVALHAPLVSLGAFVVGLVLPGRVGVAVRGCAVGLLLHALLDVLTHVVDGPLLLFPFDRTAQFSSPVSWYDPAHWGLLVLPVDVALSLGLGGRLLLDAVRGRRSRSGGGHPVA